MDFVRKWVQALIFLLTNGFWSFPVTRGIYQGPLKVLCSPGLNCYSCPAATTYCPLGALQQLLAGIRMALESGQFFVGFYVVGTMGVIGSFVGRMVCGWACPFGLLQELLFKIPSPKFSVWRPLRYIKYVLLVSMVILLPLFAVDEFGLGEPSFCKYLCPAGTLEAGFPMLVLQPALRANLGLLFIIKLLFLTLFIAWAVLASRPFCRTSCPLGAFYGLFNKVKLVRLRLDPVRCTNCAACHDVCPMGVRFNEAPDDMECISCFACSKACTYNAINLEVGGIAITKQPTPHINRLRKKPFA
jgi:ferredoxin-type protein NapH